MEIKGNFVGWEKKTASVFPVCFTLTFIKLSMNQPFVSKQDALWKSSSEYLNTNDWKKYGGLTFAYIDIGNRSMPFKFYYCVGLASSRLPSYLNPH